MTKVFACCLLALLLCSCTAVTVIGHISSVYSTTKLLKDLSESDLQSKDDVPDVWYGKPSIHNPDGDVPNEERNLSEVQQ